MLGIGTTIANAAVSIISPIIDRIFPDTEAANKAKAELALELQKNEMQLQLAAGEIIKAEAASTSWIASSWRPLTMLIFVGLIVARMFGFTAEGISEVEYGKLWDIVYVGIGGYMGARTIEKTLPGIVKAVKK